MANFSEDSPLLACCTVSIGKKVTDLYLQENAAHSNPPTIFYNPLKSRKLFISRRGVNAHVRPESDVTPL